jgi:hypothetical protein
MKQQGPTWHTADGKQTLAKFLPAHIRLQEKLGQRIAAAFEAEEKRLRELRMEIIQMAAEVYRNNPDRSFKTQFTFYTFDREYRIEYDLQDFMVRVFRATQPDPTSKDYEPIELTFKAFNAEVNDVIEQEMQKDSQLAEQVDEHPGNQAPEVGAHLPKDFNSSLFDEPKQDTAMPDNAEKAEEQAKTQRELK